MTRPRATDRKSHGGGAGALLLIALLFGAHPAATHAQPPPALNSCAGPEALVAQGLLEEAKLAYTKLAVAQNAPPCAAPGLKEVIGKLKLASAPPDPCAGATALYAHDLLEEAEEAYDKLASGDEAPTCAAVGLKATKDEIAKNRSRADRAGDWADAGFTDLENLLKAILLVVTLIVVLAALALRFDPLAQLARRCAWLLAQPRLGAGRSKRLLVRLGTTAMTPVAWAVATPLMIEKFGGSGETDGPDMSRALAGVLPVLSARQMSQVEVARTPFGAKSALTEVTEAISGGPHGKAVAAVLAVARRVVPRDQLHLTGSVLSSDARGTGLALEIVTDSGDVIDAELLWSTEFDPYLGPGVISTDTDADRTVRLATAGAVWALFAILRHRRSLRASDWARFLGTAVWRSYALFWITVNERRSPDSLTLQAGYAGALERDAGNLPALFNLAKVDIAREDWRQAIERFEAVLDGLGKREAESMSWLDRDPLRYQAAYALAYARLTMNKNPAVAGIELKLRQEVINLEKALMMLESKGGRPTQDHDDLFVQLRRFEGPLITFWVYLCEVADSKSGARTEPDLAQSALTVESRSELVTRIGLGPGYHQAIVPDFVLSHVSMGPLTQYNLASYYASVGELDKALAALEAGLELGTLIDVADEDTQLAPLKEERADALERILAIYRAADPTGLGLIGTIGPDHSLLLEQHEIKSAEDLVHRAGTPQARVALASDLGVGPSVVERWARQADLLLLGVMDVSQLNLLDAAGVVGRETLALMDPSALHKLLETVKPLPPGVTVPSRHTLRGWIERARLDPGEIRA